MSNFVLPGDKTAITEEYEAGNNACDDGNVVRATVIGENQIDKKERLVHVKNHKSLSVPEVGDVGNVKSRYTLITIDTGYGFGELESYTSCVLIKFIFGNTV